MRFKTIEWKRNSIRILDQRKLPGEVRYLDCKDASSVAKAIQEMAIRGAPAIGVAAAMGIALAAKRSRSTHLSIFRKEIAKACDLMGQTRPTAVNLFWAIERMRRVLNQADGMNVEDFRSRLVEEALRIYKEDLQVNRDIGQSGKHLIKQGNGVLTHCNAGGLATAGYGTALGVIRAAWAEGKRFHVYVDETRPLLQGARLTSWELVQEKIPCTVITDSMAGWLMKEGKIDLILVGADRIARNGDTANKIGTYSLAVLANRHRIPFYVAAPGSTFDPSLNSGKDIPIEERAPEEVTHISGKRMTPSGVHACNPAFDVTPHSLIEGFITEKGLFPKPLKKNLLKLFKSLAFSRERF
jgi:methylthioribose-1-phosphate isomerase